MAGLNTTELEPGRKTKRSIRLRNERGGPPLADAATEGQPALKGNSTRSVHTEKSATHLKVETAVEKEKYFVGGKTTPNASGEEGKKVGVVKKEETEEDSKVTGAVDGYMPRRSRDKALGSSLVESLSSKKIKLEAESKRKPSACPDKLIHDADEVLKIKALLDKWTGPGTSIKITASEISPYPQQRRPTPFEALYVRDLLAQLHGEPERDVLEENCSGQGTLLEKRARSVLDSLVRTILSQNTTDALSKRAFENLKVRYPTYKQVLAAAPGAVEETIKFAGLSDIKVGRIRAILETVLEEHPEKCPEGEPSLEFLRALPTAGIKEYLSKFKGVGPKTIACVLLFTIGHDDFAVDTHVWHIAKKLGWVPGAASREDAYKHLNNRVPDAIKYALHVLLVLHGKKCESCCKGRTQLAPDGPCPLGKLQKMREELVKAEAAAMEAAAARVGLAHVKKEEESVTQNTARQKSINKGKGGARAAVVKKEIVVKEEWA
ncbi:DNA glycosylase [Nannochloropsis gaditana]|uniref:DNA glycosylase n=1 Tax=Nannochloropsis gaditana TaxID=72520 RepID=W7U805_9STRA|nr:DNA glycosylase [Nannochloropsis gaditana]